MAKLKVSDLPKDEQVALVKQAEELGIRGIVTGWGVDTLKEKIKNAQNQKNAENGDGDQKQENADETKTDEKENKDQNEQDLEKVEDEKDEKEEKTKPVDEAKLKANVKYKICHICRSKVIDGVCTGCGFTLNP